MNEIIRRSRKWIKASPRRQIGMSTSVNAVVAGAVSFYFSRSLWHTLETVTVFLILTLSSVYWLRWSEDPASRRAARRRKRREVYASRDLEKGDTMKTVILPVVLVVLAEAGAALVMLNASPHPPPGFWLWFGGITALSPLAGYALYRHLSLVGKR